MLLRWLRLNRCDNEIPSALKIRWELLRLVPSITSHQNFFIPSETNQENAMAKKFRVRQHIDLAVDVIVEAKDVDEAYSKVHYGVEDVVTRELNLPKYVSAIDGATTEPARELSEKELKKTRTVKVGKFNLSV
jgi:hypothetical protein